jgi:ABC-type multidrug transport system fused ATPase/permease subunit
MEIPAGKKVGIVGVPGCGKSTIFDLLLRFYESDGIFIDDKPLKDYSFQNLRK